MITDKPAKTLMTEKLAKLLLFFHVDMIVQITSVRLESTAVFSCPSMSATVDILVVKDRINSSHKT